MASIYSIVTYHEKSMASEAAEAWILEGVCAVGYCDVNAKNIKNIEELKKRAKNCDAKAIN